MIGIIIQIIILIILIALSAFFSSSETALTTVSKIRMRTMAEDGDKRAALVLKITDDTQKMLSAILIGNNIVNISASSLATVVAVKLLGDYGAGIATGLMTLLVLIFGEITPKSLAAVQSVKVALFCCRIIYALMIILTPLIFILNHIVGGLLKLLGAGKNTGDNRMTEQEFRTIVDVGNETGAIENDEKDYINNLFDFSDTTVREIMIPRIDTTMINVNWSYNKLMQVFQKNMFTRFPVYEGDTDHVIGIINMKDILLVDKDKPFSVRDHIREPFFTYELKNTAELFNDMKGRHISMAIVMNEYGSVAGIITLEDMLEELVGEIRDEYDTYEEDDLIQVGPCEYVAQGSMNLEDLCEELKLPFKSEDYDTIGGYLVGLFDHFPRAGETYVSEDGIILSVAQVRRRRVVKVHIRLPEPLSNAENTVGKEP